MVGPSGPRWRPPPASSTSPPSPARPADGAWPSDGGCRAGGAGLGHLGSVMGPAGRPARHHVRRHVHLLRRGPALLGHRSDLGGFRPCGRGPGRDHRRRGHLGDGAHTSGHRLAQRCVLPQRIPHRERSATRAVDHLHAAPTTTTTTAASGTATSSVPPVTPTTTTTTTAPPPTTTTGPAADHRAGPPDDHHTHRGRARRALHGGGHDRQHPERGQNRSRADLHHRQRRCDLVEPGGRPHVGVPHRRVLHRHRDVRHRGELGHSPRPRRAWWS